MSDAYYYTRFRWARPFDLGAASAELGSDFKVSLRARPRGEDEITLFDDQRDELVAEADTLGAIMTSMRAVLFQREAKPFTARDLRLRAWVVERFDKTTPTPFPWGGSFPEPRYEVEASP